MAAPRNPVNWFEIPVAELPRAKAFYEAALGVELSGMEMGPSKMAMFPMDIEEFGASGALVQAEGYSPSHAGTMVYFPVADIDATLAKIDAAGGKTLLAKLSIGEYGHIGQFEDTEGNRVGLHTPPKMGG